MPLCTIQPPAELSPHMSQHAMFWTLPALDTGQAVLPMVSGRHPSSAHRPFGSNHLMTQSQIPPPPPPPPRQPDIQIHLKTQPPSGHATYVNGEQGTFPMMHGSTMPIWHTDPSCKSTSGHAPYNTCEPGPLPGMQMPTHKYLPSACVPCGSQHKPSIDAAMGQLMPPESHAEQWSPDLMSYLQQPMTQPAGAAVNTWPGQPMSYMPCISQHSRSRPSLALGNPHASPSSINQPPATIHSHSWQETTQAPLSLPKEPYHTKRLKQQPCSQMGLGFPGSITPRPSMSHLMSYGNQSDAQAQMPAPPTHQQLYRHFTSLSSDHQHQPDCSEMLTHEVSEPQQPNLSLEDACSQDLPGTSGCLGVPEPLAVHARAPIQHYDFNANAIPFEPLSLKRGAAAPNAQQTFQHTSGAPLCREGQATKSQTSNKTSSATRQANQKPGTKVPGWRKASIPPGETHSFSIGHVHASNNPQEHMLLQHS